MSLADALMNKFKGKAILGSDDFFVTEFLPTGIAALDHTLGGGFAFGRMHELFGNYSSGKTLVLYYLLANNQRRGGLSILFESEGAFEPNFFRKLGGDPGKLILIPVATAEEFFAGTIDICKSQQDEIKEAKKARKSDFIPPAICVGFDGIAAAGTKHLMEVGMEKLDMAKPRVMGQGVQLITTIVKSCNICLVATNQVREKLNSKDSATHTPGGHAWEFHSSQRMELRWDGGSKGSLILPRKESDDDAESSDKPVGRWVLARSIKNKTASPWASCKLPIYVTDGDPHPLYPNRSTKIGVDIDEMLFSFYLEGDFYLFGRERVLHRMSQSRYALSAALDPSQQTFYEKEWADVLDATPSLRTLVYDLQQPIAATTDSVPPTVS